MSENVEREIKEFIGEFNNSDGIFKNIVGKYVLVRDRNEGINAGFVISADKTGVVLDKARRLRRHRSAETGLWYEGVSLYGLDEEFSQVTPESLKIIVSNNYSMTVCTKKAMNNIRTFESKI